jgi:hypothetical protein
LLRIRTDPRLLIFIEENRIRSAKMRARGSALFFDRLRRIRQQKQGASF